MNVNTIAQWLDKLSNNYKCKGKVVSALNYAPRHENVLGWGGV